MDRARTKALDVLIRRTKRGSPLDPLFDVLVMKDPLLTDLDKAFVREIVYGVMRWQGRLDWVIATYSRISPPKMERVVINILRMAAYQLLFMDRIPPHAAVDESVKLAKMMGKEDAAPFVNGILRGIAEGRKEVPFPDLKTDPINHISTYYSHPPWLVRRWITQWGIEETIALCQANNQIPPFTVRVNTLKGSRKVAIQRLQDQGVEVKPTHFSPVGLILKAPPPIAPWKFFQEGWFQVQDEASQLVSYILGPHAGERVLDICAAPGGKTSHLAQLMENQGEILAADISQVKLSLLLDNCRRLGISIVKTQIFDATSPLPIPPETFDRVLVDAPCTGLGTLRRNPDGKWRVKEADITRLQKIQRNILIQAAPMVKSGGVLVYGTCTLTTEENEEVIEPFLSEHKEFRLEHTSAFLPPECEDLVDRRGYFLSFPHSHDTDGFFSVRLRKT
jgi:16S rRNA (cytosine967-C5)-methyltransferase